MMFCPLVKEPDCRTMEITPFSVRDTDAEGDPKLGDTNKILLAERLCGALPDNVIITKELTGMSNDGVNDMDMDTPALLAVQSLRFIMGMLLPKDPLMIARNATAVLKARIPPETSTMDTETLFIGGCTEPAFVMVPGNENAMSWPLLNVPDDKATVSISPAKLAVAAAPELGDVNATVFADKL